MPENQPPVTARYCPPTRKTSTSSNRNLGATSLRRRRRSTDPMRSFDALPSPLRSWLAQAALPWSPTSVRRIWARTRAKGLSTQDVIHALTRAEQRTLARDSNALFL